MPYENLIYEVEAGVATITLNRPTRLNAVNMALFRELAQAGTQAEGDPATRVVIITGAGEKAFASGAEITELKGMDPVQALQFIQEVQATVNRIEHLRKPVLAAVNGYALGAGCELAMACDLVYAADSAKFGQPEVNLGLIPGAGGTQRLPRLVGTRRAKELIFTGDIIDAHEAYRIGLVNSVFPAAELIAATRKIAEKILSKASVAVELAKSAIQEGKDLELERALALEAKAFGLCFATEDTKEGITAFLEKRQPHFKGR
ncbi:MAG: enoyl-CoA hydratase/isomerase family protein [Candidatus Methylomirabilales bacterium]